MYYTIGFFVALLGVTGYRFYKKCTSYVIQRHWGSKTLYFVQDDIWSDLIEEGTRFSSRDAEAWLARRPYGRVFKRLIYKPIK